MCYNNLPLRRPFSVFFFLNYFLLKMHSNMSNCIVSSYSQSMLPTSIGPHLNDFLNVLKETNISLYNLGIKKIELIQLISEFNISDVKNIVSNQLNSIQKANQIRDFFAYGNTISTKQICQDVKNIPSSSDQLWEWEPMLHYRIDILIEIDRKSVV